jgi:predicted TIM-barrel fold metal-dependent hydrolase
MQTKINTAKQHAFHEFPCEFLFDSHVHIMPPKRMRGLARWILRAFPDHPVTESVTAAQVLDELREEGITHFFNFVYPLSREETEPLNAFNADFCEKTPGAVGFASLHLETPDKAKIAEDAFRKYEFLGFKFHPFVQKFDPWDSRMTPLYGFLQEVERPVVFHTGFEDFYHMKMPVDRLEDILKRFPDLPVVFVHMAFPALKRVFSMMETYPQLYLDATNVPALLGPEYQPYLAALPDGPQLMDIFLNGMETHADRILFGSDHPVGMGGLPDIYADFVGLPLGDETKQTILSQTPFHFIKRFLPDFNPTPNLKSMN